MQKEGLKIQKKIRERKKKLKENDNCRASKLKG